jgi:hypothetical protein
MLRAHGGLCESKRDFYKLYGNSFKFMAMRYAKQICNCMACSISGGSRQELKQYSKPLLCGYFTRREFCAH